MLHDISTYQYCTLRPLSLMFFLAEMMVQEVDSSLTPHCSLLMWNVSKLDTAMAGDSHQDLVCSLMFHTLQNGIS